MSNDKVAATEPVDTQGMSYLVSLPRRIVTVFVPLGVFLIVLLFPFYWMVITTAMIGVSSGSVT